MTAFYHYTIGERYGQICRDRLIKPAVNLVEGIEVPAVWFSSNPCWELSASKAIFEAGARRTSTMSEMLYFGSGLVRIQVDTGRVEMVEFAQLARVLRISRTTFKKLVRAGRQMGAYPSEWAAVAGPIPLEFVSSVEIATEVDPVRWVKAFPPQVQDVNN